MKTARARVDTILLASVLFLAIGGLFIFLSASLGLLAYDSAILPSVAASQIFLGFGGGIAALFIAASIPYRLWRRASPYIFAAALLASLLVFVPHLGVTLNGARRWIALGPITFQPAELLKIAYILYLATLLSAAKNTIGDMRSGLLPFAAVTALVFLSLFLEPDTGTFLIIAGSGLAMFFAAGARWRDIGIIFLTGVVGLLLVVSVRPYAAERIVTYLHPSNDAQGAGYQVQQSLLAVGAGETFGRGFGQSIQKFGKLPEPMSDSIFSVFAEEFGFAGATVLIALYALFALRGLWLAARTPDIFGALVATGIVVLVIGESFFNIGALIGVLPLSGFPLVFISQGGSALLVALGASGILLSVSRSVRP